MFITVSGLKGSKVDVVVLLELQLWTNSCAVKSKGIKRLGVIIEPSIQLDTPKLF